MINKFFRNYRFLGFSLVIVVLDQLSKWLIKSTMNVNQSVSVLGERFFRLTYIENDGIAWGIPFGSRLFLIFFTIFAIFLLLYFIIRVIDGPLLPKIALALILGGALGNLIDRIHTGYVVDFFDFDFPDFIMYRFAVFNVADSAVTVGMTLLIIHIVFFESKQKTDTVGVNNDSAAERVDNFGTRESAEGTDRSISGPEDVRGYKIED